MTSNIRELLDQVATFEAQSRAGLTPLPGELVAFFETARLARLDVRAFDTGAVPDEKPRPWRCDARPVEIVGHVPMVRVTASAVPVATQAPIGSVPCGG